ncbi:MAG: hypothetical protein ACK4GW_13250 [Pseudorhodobacter sp.]
MLTFPLSLAQFWDRLPIADLSFDLGEALAQSRTGGGGILTADLADRLWGGTVTLGRITYAEASEVEVLISVLRQAGRSFRAHDIRRPECRVAPIPGGASPVVGAGGVTARTLAVAGLPVGFVLSPGDHMGLGSMLHRIVTGGAANGSGQIAEVEVEPAILPGPGVGDPLVLSRASITATYVADSFDPGISRRGIVDGLKFSFVERFA